MFTRAITLLALKCKPFDNVYKCIICRISYASGMNFGLFRVACQDSSPPTASSLNKRSQPTAAVWGALLSYTGARSRAIFQGFSCAMRLSPYQHTLRIYTACSASYTFPVETPSRISYTISLFEFPYKLSS